MCKLLKGTRLIINNVKFVSHKISWLTATMKTGYLLLFVLFIYSCNYSAHKAKPPVKPVPTLPKTIDTSYLKTVKWNTLNHFVKYYFATNNPTISSDTALTYSIKAIAYVNTATHVFKYAAGDSTIIKAGQIKNVILDDTFNNCANMDGLFKINSEVAYRTNPAILGTVYARLTASTKKTAAPIIARLKKENFVSGITVAAAKDTTIDSLTHSPKKGVLLKIHLKPTYRDLQNVRTVCTQLKEQHGVANVFFVDSYTGANERETYYRVSVVKK